LQVADEAVVLDRCVVVHDSSSRRTSAVVGGTSNIARRAPWRHRLPRTIRVGDRRWSPTARWRVIRGG
ncbi:MAG: hypothetical protein ACRDO0_08960, partial [Nocardioidaceae bacterium]